MVVRSSYYDPYDPIIPIESNVQLGVNNESIIAVKLKRKIQLPAIDTDHFSPFEISDPADRSELRRANSHIESGRL